MKKYVTLTSALIAALMAISSAGIINSASAENVPQGKSQAIAIENPVFIEEQQYIEYELPYPAGTDFSAKAYMDYRKIIDKTSAQYGLIHESGILENNDGFLMDGEYFAVAMGSYFGKIGSKFRIMLDNGKELRVIKTDEKADVDTDQYHIRDIAGGIIELVIDTEAEFMQENTMSNGYVFHGDFNNCDKFVGNIIKIEREI